MVSFREWLREAAECKSEVKESKEYKEYFKRILTKYNVEILQNYQKKINKNSSMKWMPGGKVIRKNRKWVMLMKLNKWLIKSN